MIDQIIEDAWQASQRVVDTYHFQPGAYKRDYESREYWSKLRIAAFKEISDAYNRGYRDGYEQGQ